MNGNKFATGIILEKPVEVVKGRIFAGWAQKSPEPWGSRIFVTLFWHWLGLGFKASQGAKIVDIQKKQ